MRGILAASVLLVCLLGFVGISHAQVTLVVTPTNQFGEILVPGALLSPGDQITFDIAARNDGTPFFALGASAVDYDTSLIAFRSGSGVPVLFADACIPGTGCVGGLDFGSVNVTGVFSEEITPMGPEVQIFNHLSASITPVSATGEDDWGTSGIPGDPQARIIFDVVGISSFQQQDTIRIGAFEEYGDAVILGSPRGGIGVVETIWVVPEPGTALLLGLGLVGLGMRRAERP